MPSVSKKQHNLMAAVAHNPGFAKKVGIPQSVGKDFNEADKMKKRKFFDGGTTALPGGGPGALPGGGLGALPGSGTSTLGNIPNPQAAMGGMRNSPMARMKKGGNVSMEKKVAGYFAKKGEKALAAHEEREAAGKEKDTKAIAKKEEAALKGAPKAMKDYEKKEHKEMGFKKGGMRGMPRRKAALPPDMGPMAGGPSPMGMGMCKGGKARGMAKGGGIESKGKTKGSVVKMARGGGIESKGKTRGRFC